MPGDEDFQKEKNTECTGDPIYSRKIVREEFSRQRCGYERGEELVIMQLFEN